MSELTRDDIEALVAFTDGPTREGLLAHDALQRQRIAQLEAEVNAMRTASQLTHFILEHPDGDYDKPEQIQAEAEQYGLEKLFALKAEVARLNGVVTSLKQSEMYWVGEAEKYSAEVARLTAERDHLADLHNELRNR